MNTRQLLEKVHELMQANPAVSAEINWDDVVSCIQTEIVCLEDAYPADQYAQITAFWNSLFTDLKAAAASSDNALLYNILDTMLVAIKLMPDSAFLTDELESGRFAKEALRHMQNKTTVVLGDSHVNFFSGSETLNFHGIGHDINCCPQINDANFSVLHLGPCLAYQCIEPESSTNFWDKLNYLLDNFIQPGSTLILCLGEIDLRAHVLKQAQKQGVTPEAIVDEIIERYSVLLGLLQQNGYTVYAWGPIASQPDSCPMDPAFPRYGLETERNKATAYFNAKLKEACTTLGVGCLSIFEQMVDEQYRTRMEYLSPDHCHLSQAALEIAPDLLSL